LPAEQPAVTPARPLFRQMGEVVATAHSNLDLLAPAMPSSTARSSLDLIAPPGPPGSTNVIAPSEVAPASSNVIAPRGLAQQWDFGGAFNPFHVPARPSTIARPSVPREVQDAMIAREHPPTMSRSFTGAMHMARGTARAETRATSAVRAGSRSRSQSNRGRASSVPAARAPRASSRQPSVVSVHSSGAQSVGAQTVASTPRRATSIVSVRSGSRTPSRALSIVSVRSGARTPSREPSVVSVRSSAAGTVNSSNPRTISSSSGWIRFDEVNAGKVRSRSRATR
jgi:hypothetical protein